LIVTDKSTFDPLIDEEPSRYVVGIDLGTTNSAVTYIDSEEEPWGIRVLSIPQLVAAGEIESLDTLPSFHFQPASTGDRQQLKMAWDKKAPQFCVGSYARDETARTSGRGIASAKSWLCHTGVDRTAALLPWHGAADVKRLSPVDVSGQYLRHVRQAWNARFADHPLADQDIVLTLPASFDEVGRELTIQAAAAAGLRRVVLIEEPQAAFYAWVDKHAEDWESRVQVGQKILVCDIGGGTTDFTLIRVRRSEASTAESPGETVQFHRVAVGNHLILGGDNLDLAIAKFLEQKLTSDQGGQGKVEAHQWDVLIGSSRNIKEQMLSAPAGSSVDKVTVSLPGRGSKLIGGSLQTEVTREEICDLIINGFLPATSLDERPQTVASGFQEFGLPYASDPAITRHLGEFLTTHADAGLEASCEEADASIVERARPDVVLFNGGFFASPVLRQTVVDRISQWFDTAGGGENDPPWSPQVLENERLDLAVARGAAYYGIVRRDKGVRIAASLARSYYMGIGDNRVVCVMPGNAEPGQSFTLADRKFRLTISQPVEFSIYVSSIRLADQPGAILELDPEQMTSLPPIRTVLRARSRNEKRDLSVELRTRLTEIGTIDLACHECDSDRSWKLQFDIRSTTQTDMDAHESDGEAEGLLDEQTWQDCEQRIRAVFGPEGDGDGDQIESADPNELPQQLHEALGMSRAEWPMPFLRRCWEALMEFEWDGASAAVTEKKTDVKAGRRKSRQHEARWLNLLGFALRPGYGVAMDDWRVTETWRALLQRKLIHASSRHELLILWRRLSGGLSRGQQLSLADPWMASLRALAKQMSGKASSGGAIPLRPEESSEVWRLLGSLELLPAATKMEIGDFIASSESKPRLKNARSAMIWALGRLGQRTPLYGPLNTVVSSEQASRWIEPLLNATESTPVEHLAVVQMSRLTNDRFRDLDDSVRKRVVDWLTQENAATSLIRLVREGGALEVEDQGKVFGESLPQGLRLEG
jgi:molecular chaperone DnaK (HSP70)